ncbi:SHOCT domain-containing protein [Flagellimonas hymeniacidonis]|uniref:SHOCT domain-containing protein n=1 Tax=Flagellimonas hymeniacidonis TaxID=2603628 RepID=A0A5C8V3F4_9FLAO|nr:SHOCT domain-containing protein [Flagellimonas hymeniacidonis]TXN36084.1 SHOCT domain-containing protein [Flagellimonas hymeniacidonis]
MDDILFQADGRNGSVLLYPNRLIVRKKLTGLKRMMTSGDKEIFLDDIKNVNYKSANTMTWGFIQFATSQNSKELSKGSLMASPMDDYSINFSKKQQSEFDKLKSEINRLRNGSKSQTVIQNQLSEAEELEKLAGLKEKGIITQEEFDLKKRQVLGI